MQKEKEYQDIIKSLEQGAGRRDSQREKDLAQII